MAYSPPNLMNPKRPTQENTFDLDGATMAASSASLRSASPSEEWALIRYVGHPIGEVINLRSTGMIIGRSSDNDICLAEAEVSRRHSRLEVVMDGGQAVSVTLQDLGSTNGTFVNGKKLAPNAEPTALQNGDVVRVGSHAFKLKRLDDMERHYHEVVLTQTTVDPLTGVGNRATVLGHLEKHFDLARRYKRPLSVILADLDFFKAVNDTYGHATGDLVLQTFGVILLGRLRGSDQVGRLGGEEFLVVLPETHGHEAVSVAENLRNAIKTEPVSRPDGTPFYVKVSLGVAQIQDSDANAGSLLARADVALYRAKNLGRDRVEFDSPL
ncbi:MAG: GGDEF domain-containing protein [Acidobacteriota bacterium]|nr:GGDEF domain-containing protein [Acidobacteriota bacterium]